MVSATKGSRLMTVAIAASALIGIIGVALWIYQMGFSSQEASMMNDYHSWGVYIMLFMFMVGLGAGSALVGCFLHMQGNPKYLALAKPAVWLSFCCIILAMLFVTLDLGQPLRLLELVTSPRMGSPLMWDIIALPLLLVADVVFLARQTKSKEASTTGKGEKASSIFVMACSILALTVDAWIFGLMSAQDAWNTALLAPWFVVSAIASGIALLILSSFAFAKADMPLISTESRKALAKWLGVFVAVDLYCLIAELVTSAYPGAESATIVHMLLAGQLAPWFWTEVAAAVLAVACCLPAISRYSWALALGSVAALVSIFCKRFQFLSSGFAAPGVDLPGIVPGTFDTLAAAGIAYAPSLLEIAIAIGFLSLGLCLFLIGQKLFGFVAKEAA